MNKKIREILATIIAVVFLAGCGGGSDEEKSSPSPPPPSPPDPPPSPVWSGGNITLGPVKDATVNIYPFQSNYKDYSLFQTTSDNNGKISVDVSVIEQKISDYGLSPQYLLIVSHGGIDTDPNDDGLSVASEFKTVSSNVFGLAHAANLSSLTKFNVNLISSAMVDFFLGQNELEKEEIETFLTSLGFTDQDNNGVINLDDVIHYDMIQDESTVEDTLRTLYLDYIHSGDQVMQELVLTNLTERKGVYRIKTPFQNEHRIDIEIYPKHDQGQLEYYYADNSSSVIKNEDTRYITISLNTGEGIYFRECLEDNCGKYELMYYDGSRIKKGSIPLQSVSHGYEDEAAMERVRTGFMSAVDDYVRYDELKPRWASDMKTLEEQLSNNMSQLDMLDSELENVGIGYE